MNERLISILKRHEELTELIQDPLLVKNQNRYRDIMKEHSHMDDIVQMFNKVQELENQINDTKELIHGEKDQEMKELAREELNELESILIKKKKN